MSRGARQLAHQLYRMLGNRGNAALKEVSQELPAIIASDPVPLLLRASRKAKVACRKEAERELNYREHRRIACCGTDKASSHSAIRQKQKQALRHALAPDGYNLAF